jgi:hypothetical protein
MKSMFLSLYNKHSLLLLITLPCVRFLASRNEYQWLVVVGAILAFASESEAGCQKQPDHHSHLIPDTRAFNLIVFFPCVALVAV